MKSTNLSTAKKIDRLYLAWSTCPTCAQDVHKWLSSAQQAKKCMERRRKEESGKACVCVSLLSTLHILYIHPTANSTITVEAAACQTPYITLQHTRIIQEIHTRSHFPRSFSRKAKKQQQSNNTRLNSSSSFSSRLLFFIDFIFSFPYTLLLPLRTQRRSHFLSLSFLHIFLHYYINLYYYSVHLYFFC